MKRITAAMLLCGLVSACTTAPEIKAGGRASADASPASSKRATVQDAPPVQMQVGTAFVKGRLVRACGPDGCEDGTGSTRRALRLTDERILMFAIGRKPKAAAVVIRRAGSGKVVDRKNLRPGTTMPYVVDLKNARYEVLLDGEWSGFRARWSFRLTVDEP